MAALVEGQQYGLSAQDKINSTKSLIFVKLTDSALRSIEEYVRRKEYSTYKPTIQFNDSSGIINLPHSSHSQSYGFTLSNVEADGPQGSFECLRQSGNRSLESLGCMQVKMHIHANEESYENTRVKMAAAEKQQKESCTKVIKPAGAHLGRKVKVKRPGLAISPVKFSPPTASMLSKPSIKPVSPKQPTSISLPIPVKKTEPPKPPVPQPPKNPELMRQPIRDRIIHILAVRPYKKPEILVRLRHEGVREKDKNKLSSILPQVSTTKGNIYYLANYLWNEVQDNWKFYSPEEAEIIKKRKQQHLNSNSQGDTSLSSSQQNGNPLQKRMSTDVPNGHLPSKKQRISHYKGDQRQPYENPLDILSNSIGRGNSNSPLHTQSLTNGATHNGYSRLKSPLSNGFATTPSPPLTNHSSKSSPPFPSLSQRTKDDPARNPTNQTVKQPFRGHPPTEKSSGRSEKNLRHSAEPTKPRINNNSDSGKSSHALSQPRSVNCNWNSKPVVSPDSKTSVMVAKDTQAVYSNGAVNGHVVNGKSDHHRNGLVNGKSQCVSEPKVTSTTNGSGSSSPLSSGDSRDSVECNQNDFKPPTSVESTEDYENTDYEKDYITIVSNEQRAQYKADFNDEYHEYLKLHESIKAVQNVFDTLSKKLIDFKENTQEQKKLQGRIYREYKLRQKDPQYLSNLKKFNFLHNKLAYIKRLVSEYDIARFPKS